MHYGLLVILDEHPKNLDAAIQDALEPFKDTKWDWYQIGGRWTGALSGYQPDEDPLNRETCDLCGGTGDRATWRNEPTANQHPTGCNGCLGKGVRSKWPGKWVRHEGDIVPTHTLTDEAINKNFHAVIVGHHWHGGEDYRPWLPSGEIFAVMPKPPAEWLKSSFPNGIAVVVDIHN